MSRSLMHEGFYRLINCKFIEIIPKVDAFDLKFCKKLLSTPKSGSNLWHPAWRFLEVKRDLEQDDSRKLNGTNDLMFSFNFVFFGELI